MFLHFFANHYFYEYQNGYRKILHHFQILFYPIFPIKAIPLHPEKQKQITNKQLTWKQ